jgi:hypothetical protein
LAQSNPPRDLAIYEATEPRAERLGHDLHETIKVAGWLEGEGALGYTRNEVLRTLEIPGGSKAQCRQRVIDTYREVYRPGATEAELTRNRQCRRVKNKSHGPDCPFCDGSGLENEAPLAKLSAGGAYHYWDAFALWACWHLKGEPC